MCYNRTIQISIKNEKENNLSKTKQKIKQRIIVTKVKLRGNLVQKKVLLVVRKHSAFLIQTLHCKKRRRKTISGVNKTADEQGIEGSHKKIYIWFKKKIMLELLEIRQKQALTNKIQEIQ